jgi:hypothetical protein
MLRKSPLWPVPGLNSLEIAILINDQNRWSGTFKSKRETLRKVNESESGHCARSDLELNAEAPQAWKQRLMRKLDLEKRYGQYVTEGLWKWPGNTDEGDGRRNGGHPRYSPVRVFCTVAG